MGLQREPDWQRRVEAKVYIALWQERDFGVCVLHRTVA